MLQGGAGQPVEAPVDFQQDREQVAGLIPVSPDNARHHGFIRNLGIGGAGVDFRFRQLYFVVNGTDIQAGAASRAFGGIDVAGFLFQGSRKVPGLTFNILQFGKGKELDVSVPADLDQLGRDNSHGAVIGGKGLVDLCHGTANGRALFHQVDEIPCIGQVQRGLHPGNPTTDNHHRSQNFIGHNTSLL